MPILRDGYRTLATITGSAISWEIISATLPALQGGGAIDQTTMANNNWRTAWGKTLKTFGTITLRVAYDMAVYTQIRDIIGVNKHIVLTAPDGAQLTFYGFVDNFTPEENREGERPEATVEIIPTNLSTAAPPVLTGPVLTTGTTTTVAP